MSPGGCSGGSIRITQNPYIIEVSGSTVEAPENTERVFGCVVDRGVSQAGGGSGSGRSQSHPCWSSTGRVCLFEDRIIIGAGPRAPEAATENHHPVTGRVVQPSVAKARDRPRSVDGKLCPIHIGRTDHCGISFVIVEINVERVLTAKHKQAGG